MYIMTEHHHEDSIEVWERSSSTTKHLRSYKIKYLTCIAQLQHSKCLLNLKFISLQAAPPAWAIPSPRQPSQLATKS